MSFDPAKHPRGFHGRFGSGGSGGRKKVDRSLENRGAAPSASSVTGRVDASTARQRKERAPTKARAVRGLYDKHASGRATYQEREAISFQAPKLRDAQTAKTGSPVRPREQAIAAVREQTHGARSGFRSPRTSVKTTFAGKTAVVRGEDRPGPKVHRVPTASQKKSARGLMSSKPATPAVHRQYTAGQLSLKTDAALRDILTSRGTPVPKGARTKTLVGLIVGK